MGGTILRTLERMSLVAWDILGESSDIGLSSRSMNRGLLGGGG
jgi:hypothetical protein